MGAKGRILILDGRTGIVMLLWYYTGSALQRHVEGTRLAHTIHNALAL